MGDVEPILRQLLDREPDNHAVRAELGMLLEGWGDPRGEGYGVLSAAGHYPYPYPAKPKRGESPTVDDTAVWLEPASKHWPRTIVPAMLDRDWHARMVTLLRTMLPTVERVATDFTTIVPAPWGWVGPRRILEDAAALTWEGRGDGR